DVGHEGGAAGGAGAGGRVHLGERAPDRARRAAVRRDQGVGLRQGARPGGVLPVHRAEVGGVRAGLSLTGLSGGPSMQGAPRGELVRPDLRVGRTGWGRALVPALAASWGRRRDDLLGGPPVEAVPAALAVHAPGRLRTEAESLGGNALAAVFA